MPTAALRRTLQMRLPTTSTKLPASVGVGLALPAAVLGVVLVGMDLHIFGLVAWTAAIVLIAFVFDVYYALTVAAAVALSGALLGHLLFSEAAVLSRTEQVAFVLVTMLAVAIGQLIAREMRQRDATRLAQFHLDVFSNVVESVFEGSRDCVKLLAPDGAVLAINSSGLKLIGATEPEQMVGHSWFSFWGSEQQNALAEAWRKVLTQGHAEFDGSCRILSGERRNWRNTFTLVSTPERSQAYVVCISRDVTDSITLQQTLRASVTQLNGLLDGIDDASFALDSNWTINFANRRAEQLAEQMGQAGAKGRSFWEVFPISPGEPAAIFIRRAMEQQTSQHCEYLYTQQQRWFGLTAFPAASGINILARDITQQKAAQKSSIEEKARLQVAQDIAGFGDWSFDYEHGLMRFSQRALGLLDLENCPPHEYKKCLLDKLHPHDRMALVQAIINCSAAVPTMDVIVRMPQQDGSEKHLHWLGRLVTDEYDNATHLLGAVQDISTHLYVQSVPEKTRSLVRDLIDVLPQQIVVVDSEGHYVIANHAWERTVVDSGEARAGEENFFESATFAQIVDAPLIDVTRAAAREILRGTSTYFEREYELAIGGVQRCFQIQLLPFKRDSETLLLVVRNDITPAKSLANSATAAHDHAAGRIARA